MMYEAYQAQADLLWPVRNFTKAFLPSLKEGRHAWSQWEPHASWPRRGRCLA